MPESLSSSTQDYLKCVWTLGEWHDGPVSVTALAERLGLRTSSVSDGVRKLAEAGLLEHETYGGVTLTERGRAHAVAMVRRHRLLETFLVSELGYTWDQVHDEAEVLEHAISDRLLNAIDARLGFPTRDPHGDPIPTPSGDARQSAAVRLADAAAGTWRIVRISDADPARLRRLADAGIGLDCAVTVGLGHGREVHREVSGTLLDAGDAEAIWVVEAQPSSAG